MKFIKVWSYICANYLTIQLKESHEKKRVYYYGFQIIIGGIVKAVILITLALLVGAIVPALIILLVFGSLRVLAGGFHMDTYGKCIATSTALFIGAGVLSQYTYEFWRLEHMIILLFAIITSGIFIISKWAPKDTPNKPITKIEDIRRYKRLSLIYLLIWSVINIVLMLYGHSNDIDYINLIILSASMGVILELFTVTPAGYGFFEKISSHKRRLHNS